ncbi:MAG TPA: LptE family protein [Syntrophobacteria bacterium]|nr:LptE family protein [Syntrophobacteria bacterium]
MKPGTLDTGSSLLWLRWLSGASSVWRAVARTILLCFAALGIGLSGCGYHFVGNDVQAPGNIQSIAVGVVENKTTIVGIETIFTDALLNEFIRTQRLAVKPPTEADAILSGAITSIKTDAVSHLDAEKTLETRVTVGLSLTLKQRESGKILWENKALSYYQDYTDRALPLATSENRRLAIAYIANFLAEKVYQEIFASF